MCGGVVAPEQEKEAEGEDGQEEVVELEEEGAAEPADESEDALIVAEAWLNAQLQRAA